MLCLIFLFWIVAAIMTKYERRRAVKSRRDSAFAAISINDGWTGDAIRGDNDDDGQKLLATTDHGQNPNEKIRGIGKYEYMNMKYTQENRSCHDDVALCIDTSNPWNEPSVIDEAHASNAKKHINKEFVLNTGEYPSHGDNLAKKIIRDDIFIPLKEPTPSRSSPILQVDASLNCNDSPWVVTPEQHIIIKKQVPSYPLSMRSHVYSCSPLVPQKHTEVNSSVLYHLWNKNADSIFNGELQPGITAQEWDESQEQSQSRQSKHKRYNISDMKPALMI